MRLHLAPRVGVALIVSLVGLEDVSEDAIVLYLASQDAFIEVQHLIEWGGGLVAGGRYHDC